MNLLRNKSFNIVKTIFLTPSRMFVGLKPDVVKKLTSQETPKKYYDQLLEEAPSNDKGYIKVEPIHLTRLIEKCKTEEDIPVVVEAYINLLGHKTTFTNKVIDSLLLKAVECKNPKPVFDIIRNHNYLMYYPHYDVLTKISEYYKETKNAEEGKEFLAALTDAQLIKYSPKLLRSVIDTCAEIGDHSFAVKAYEAAKAQNVPIDTETYDALLVSVREYTTSQKKRAGIEKDLLGRLENGPLEVADYLKISLSLVYSLNDSITVLEQMVEKHKPTIKEGSFYFENTDSNKEYFTIMYENLAAHPFFFKRFTGAIKEIKRKYLKNAAAPEIISLMAENNIKISEESKKRAAAAEEKSAEPKGEKKAQPQAQA